MEDNTFTGATLDRAGEHRGDDDWVAQRAADPAARAVMVGDGGVLVRDGRLARVPLAVRVGRRLAAHAAGADQRRQPVVHRVLVVGVHRPRRVEP